MEQKSDFIEREVQKLMLFLKSAIAKISKEGNTNASINSLDKELKGKLDFGFHEILQLKKEELKNKIKGVNVLILERLLKLFYEIDQKELKDLDSFNLKCVSLFIIEELENTSKVYSLERDHIKNYFKSEKKRN